MPHPKGTNKGIAAIGATPVQLAPSPTYCKDSVRVKADSGNGQAVYVGFSSAVTPGTTAATDGYPLAAGQEIEIPVFDAGLVWVVAPSGSQKVYYLAV